MVQFATTVPVTANELVAVAARAPGVAMKSASSKTVQNARRSFRKLAVRVSKWAPRWCDRLRAPRTDGQGSDSQKLQRSRGDRSPFASFGERATHTSCAPRTDCKI